MRQELLASQKSGRGILLRPPDETRFAYHNFRYLF